MEEKKAATETITNAQGLDSLYKAMKSTNEECGQDGKQSIYSNELMQKIKDILKIYSELDKMHSRRSIQTKEEEDFDSRHEGYFKWNDKVTDDNLELLEFLIVSLVGELGETANVVKK